MVRRRALTLGVVMYLTLGCGSPRPVRDVANPDPSGKIPAIKESVQRQDMNAVRQLVRDLDSDDPAVRFFAIQGLQRLTGETFGYQYFDDETSRKSAIEKWQAWLQGWEAGKQQRGWKLEDRGK